jgi:hypothetical protein
VVKRSPISRAYLHSYEDGTFSLTEYFCPVCGTLLDCEVGFPDDEPLHDDIYISIDGGALRSGR